MPDMTIPRNKFSKPLIVPPEGGRAVAYSRPSSYGEVLDSTYLLERWKIRKALEGFWMKPALQVTFGRALRIPDDRLRKAALDAVGDEALREAGASDRADIGTSLHAVVEDYHDGVLGNFPAQYERDIAAYSAARDQWGLDVLAQENFVVNDGRKAAGTFDQLVMYEGEPTIADLKTGSVYGWNKISIQLALYAWGVPYRALGEDPQHELAQTGTYRVERAQWEQPPSLTRALVIWLPQGEGKCELHEVDLTAALDGVSLVQRVHDWRALRTKLSRRVA